MPLLLVLSAASFVSAFTIQLLNPLMPAIARDFGMPVEQAAMLASAFAITYALAQPLLGPIGDALGKALVIKVCLGMLGLSLLVGAVAQTFEQLFVARMLSGVAGGGIIPVAFAMIGDRFAVAERQVALARLVMAAQIAILLGAMVGGLVAAQMSWRYMFFVPAVLTAIAFILALRSLTPRADAQRLPISLARSKAGYLEAVSGPFARITLGGVFFGGMALWGLLPFIAGRLEQRGLAGLSESGLVIGCLSLGGLVFTIFVKQLLVRLGRGGLVRTGGMLATTGLAVVAFSPHWLVEAAAFFCVGLGYFMVHNSLQALATELAPTARGSGVALFACVLFTGQALGPLVYRAMFAAFGQNVPVLIGAAVLLIVALIVSRKLYAADRVAVPTA